ncbi:MAG: hypothetical protein IPQ03_10165 [Bacteroidetes bacterium]|nr:hypothetical protein [Bacteroidota bacterium]
MTGNTILSIAASGNNVFASTNQGLFLSSDNGNSWSSINIGLTNSLVRTIVVSGSSVFIGNDDGVFLSTNNGGNWIAVNTGLTNTWLYIPLF